MAIDPDVQILLDEINQKITNIPAPSAGATGPSGSTGPQGATGATGTAGISTGGGGSSVKDPTLIAASNASAEVKALAKYVATGVNDHNLINQVIAEAALPTRLGEVKLSGGTFNVGGSLVMTTGVWLHGAGVLTEIKSNKITALAGYAAEPAVITNKDKGDHFMRVSDLWLNGNYTAGGTAHGIGFRCSGGSGSRNETPDSNPDPDITIHDVYISGFMGGTRHGILMDTDCRGSLIDRIQIRKCSGNGIWMKDSPDSHLSNIHIGGAAKAGFKSTGGNVKFTSCKAYYCDEYAFSLESGRAGLAACEAQDSANGFYFGAAEIVASSLIADTSKDDSFVINSDRVQLSAASAFNRGNGRYPTTARGFALNGKAAITVTGTANKVTTAVSGTGTGFIRIVGQTPYSVG